MMAKEDWRSTNQMQPLMKPLEATGVMPLPPYIPRPDGVREDDSDHYQTMFAAHNGAVAAPTAGLHFTPDLINEMNAKGINMAEVTLHVGAGTFLPVKVDDVRDHKMHSEWGEDFCRHRRADQRNKSQWRAGDLCWHNIAQDFRKLLA